MLLHNNAAFAIEILEPPVFSDGEATVQSSLPTSQVMQVCLLPLSRALSPSTYFGWIGAKKLHFLDSKIQAQMN